MKRITTIFTLCATIGFKALYAQDDCKVLLTEISGKYEGDCKKGKAEGQGKATGQDEYEGQFRAGYPDGKGTYTWKNGDSYEGMWVKGKREGDGQLTVKRAGKADSVVRGFWKKNEYVGAFEKPFMVHYRTNHITKVEVRKTKETSRSIDIEISSTSGGVPTITGTILPKVEITQINVSKGNYTQLQHVSTTTKGSIKRLVDVTFPFRAKFHLGTQEVDLEILEPGTWSTLIVLNE